MGELSDIVKDLNWPKQILDKSEALLKTLFGPSFEEFGGMISDQVKLRRFKNQLKIFTKAQDIEYDITYWNV
jgi:alpha/beta superfamily hydrolase